MRKFLEINVRFDESAINCCDGAPNQRQNTDFKLFACLVLVDIYLLADTTTPNGYFHFFFQFLLICIYTNYWQLSLLNLGSTVLS